MYPVLEVRYKYRTQANRSIHHMTIHHKKVFKPIAPRCIEQAFSSYLQKTKEICGQILKRKGL